MNPPVRTATVGALAAMALSFVVVPEHVRAQTAVHVVDPTSDYADDYLATYSSIALDRPTGQLGKGGVAMAAHQASANSSLYRISSAFSKSGPGADFGLRGRSGKRKED